MDLNPQFIASIEAELSRRGVTKYDADGWSNNVQCIFGTHDHDDKNPAFAWNNQSHSSKCFKCDETWNAKQTGLALGIVYPTHESAIKVETTKRKYNDLKAYAEAHGATEDVFIAAGWEFVTYQGRPAIKFPTAGGWRYRFLDGEEPVYKSDEGYKLCWYGLDKALGMSFDHVVICNGEASTVVAQSYGIPACCQTSGEKALSESMLAQLQEKWQGKVLIAMDADTTGRKAARQIAQQVGEKARIIDLPFTDGGDLADWCKLHTGTSWAQLLTLEQQKEEKPLADAMNDLSAALRETARAKVEGATEAQLAKLVQRAEKELIGIKTQIHKPMLTKGQDVMLKAAAQVESNIRNPGGVRGLTSIASVDKLVGGYLPNRVYTIEGDTGMGKTTFATSIASILCLQAKGLVISTESSPDEWLTKMACAKSRIPYDLVEMGEMDKAQQKRLDTAMAAIDDYAPMFLDDPSPNVNAVQAAIKQAVEDYAIKWVIVDSASNLSADSGTIYEDSRGISKGILAATLSNPVALIQTVQIGRNTKGRANKRPGLHDAKGAGDWEQDSGVVLSLYNHQYYVDLGEADPDDRFPEDSCLVTVLKNRWRGTRGKMKHLQYIGGAGFYEGVLRTVQLGSEPA